MIDGLGVGIIALKADAAALGRPDTHALGLQLRQVHGTASEAEGIGILLPHIGLLPEKAARPVNGNAPGLLFHHNHHLDPIISQNAEKR